MDDVRRAQEQVINIKNELHETGNKKRLIQRDLDILRRDLNKVYKEFKINWNSCQYLELVKKEVDIYTEIDELQKELAAVDGHEQYLFNAFSVAINDSYEKEKIYTNMIKILGIVGTLLGSFITFVLSVVGFLYNQRKFYTLRKDVQSALTDQVLHKLDKVIEDIKDFQQTVNVKQSMVLTEKPVESWGSYLNRNTRWIYGWALPKK
ncbi:mitochondrial potassium channel isoform X3 [Bactrocera oleae]|nr:mitochondrial potassium channel isoform X5 [Bactrocera oleae]XP_036219537.1 mitochondrial potassium channel isoform X5 [Bactrocera oleae]